MNVSVALQVPTPIVDVLNCAAVDQSFLADIATGHEDLTSISYDEIESIPEIIGRPLNTGISADAIPLDLDEMDNEDTYASIGGGFDNERAFLNRISSRVLPPSNEIKALYWQHAMAGLTELKSVRSITIRFIHALSELREGRGAFASHYFGNAAKWFSRIGLNGASAICYEKHCQLHPALTADGKAMSHRLIAYEIMDSIRGRSEAQQVGAAYLYGLHYAKGAGRFGGSSMQWFFLNAAKAFDRMGRRDEAINAYLASLWALEQRIAIGDGRYDPDRVGESDRVMGVDATLAAYRILQS